jgi:predicted ester cyclase
MSKGSGLIERFYNEVIADGNTDLIPDLTPKSVEPMLADGDLEAGRVILSGTHQGELMGVPASGKTVEFESIDIIRLEDGKVVEHWASPTRWP